MKKVLVTIMVVLFATVVLGQTKKQIKTTELQKCSLEWIKKNYTGFSIEQVYKIDNGTDPKFVPYYHVKLMKMKQIQWLRFGKDCRDVKKMTEAEAQTDPPKQMPPVKPPENINKEKTQDTKK